VSKARAVLIGGGGAGAGGSPYWGGGGGAGGDVVLIEFEVTPAEVWNYSQDPIVNPSASSGNPGTALPLSGLYTYEGSASILTRVSDSKQIIALGGGSGLYNASGGGSGGPAPSGSGIESGITYYSIVVLRGKVGEAASGSRGGRGGAAFGSFSRPPSNYLGGTYLSDADGDGSGGGGSSVAASPSGGANGAGQIVIVFFP
jgi:hypothetical protein